MSKLIWSHQQDLRLYQIMPTERGVSSVKPLRLRVHLNRNVPSMLEIRIPYCIVPLFWEWATADKRLGWQTNHFPNLEAETRWIENLSIEVKPDMPWTLVHRHRKTDVRLIWDKAGTTEPHTIGYIPRHDIDIIAQRAFDSFRAAENLKRNL